MSLSRGTIVSFASSTGTAVVRVDGSGSLVLTGIAVARGLGSADLVANRRCIVDTGEHNNVGDFVVTAVYDSANGAYGGGGLNGVIQNPRDWQDSRGSEYHAQFGNQDLFAAAGGSNLAGLDGFGWVVTSINSVVDVAGSADQQGVGDFLSASDVDAVAANLNASLDDLRSPQIFGGYGGALGAAAFLGALPTVMTFECLARFVVSSANEVTSYLGFVKGGGSTDISAAGNGIAIVSDAVNFKLWAAAVSDLGAAVDTLWHRWKIVVGANVEWYIDDVSQGTVALPTDVFPMCVGFKTGTTNRLRVASCSVKYS